MDRKAAALRASGSGRRRGSGFAGKKKAVMVKTGTGACRRHPQPARANTDMPPAPMGAGGREGEKCLRVQRGGSRDAKAQRFCEGMVPPTVRGGTLSGGAATASGRAKRSGERRVGEEWRSR